MLLFRENCKDLYQSQIKGLSLINTCIHSRTKSIFHLKKIFTQSQINVSLRKCLGQNQVNVPFSGNICIRAKSMFFFVKNIQVNVNKIPIIAKWMFLVYQHRDPSRSCVRVWVKSGYNAIKARVMTVASRDTEDHSWITHGHRVSIHHRDSKIEHLQSHLCLPSCLNN